MGVRRSAEEARPWGGEIITRLAEPPPDRLSRIIATSVILSLYEEKHFQRNFVVRVHVETLVMMMNLLDSRNRHP